jgi:hypothetical protein
VPPGTDALAPFIAGFVAAEGTFVHSGRRFTFAVGLGGIDASSCHALHEYFGRGSVTTAARRRPHYDDEVTFAIQSLRDHVEVTVPFMDEHLPPSYKREQYRRWRGELLAYWNTRARRAPT